MFGLGFSYVGVIFLVMLFVPNIIWTKNKPEGYEESSKKENKFLLALERIGEVMACSIVAIADCNVRIHSIWLGWLMLAALLMILYEGYWICYFNSPKTLADMYSSFAGFPVAGASLPVVALLFLGIYACSLWIIVTSLILGIGHVGIHLAHRKEALGSAKGNGDKKPKKNKVFRIVKGVLVALMAILILELTVVIGVRNVNCIRCFIDTSKWIDEETYVEINGQSQFIKIRGRDKNAPVLLYLHGGPCSPDSFYAFSFTNELIDDYLVVCWDQRGCGRTYVNNDDKDNQTVSFDQALRDLNVLADYLRETFAQDKIIVLGHSYGSVLGSRFAYDHPEKVAAFIGIGQYVNAATALKYEYEDALSKAMAAGDDVTALKKAYETFLQDKTLENSTAVSDLAAPYHPAPRAKNLILAALASPTLSTQDIMWYANMTSYEAFLKYAGSLMDYLMDVDLRASQPSYEVPVFFVSGDCDYNCAWEDVADYAKMLGAKCDLIQGCWHNVHYDDPKAFATIVKEDLKSIERK